VRIAFRTRCSSFGFDWGYSGPGPARLALSLLADNLAADARALRRHEAFKRQLVLSLPHEGWSVTSAEVEAALREAEIQEPSLETPPLPPEP